MKRLTIEGFNFTSDFVASNLQSYPIAEALTRLQKYEDVGAVEEFKRLKEKQMPNKPKYLKWCDFGCPSCKKVLPNRSQLVEYHYCQYCGQKLDWD